MKLVFGEKKRELENQTPSSSPLCEHPLRGWPAYPTSGGESYSSPDKPVLSLSKWGGREGFGVQRGAILCIVLVSGVTTVMPVKDQ